MVPFLRDAGHKVYDFKNPSTGVKGFTWSDIGLEGNFSADDYRQALYTEARAAQGFMNDLRAMEWADTCVLLLPCGRSAHLEAGWFCGRGKRCIVLTEDGQEPELMALLANEICISPQEVLEVLK
jgi:enhancing lycopene biosynthesis protein 2